MENSLQQQRLGGGIPKSAHILEAVGHDSESARKDRSNGAVLGSNVQCSGAIDGVIWQQDLGGDQGDAQGPDGVPTLGGATDHGDDIETRGRRRVVLPSGGGSYGRCGATPHRGVHQEAEEYHSG